LFCETSNWPEGPSIDFMVILKLIVKKWRVQSIHLAWNIIHWRAVVKRIRSHQEAENFLTS
jgi:hypothetical protein